MSKQTRIGLIRNVIVKFGGQVGRYYADGPNGISKRNDGNVRYKIEKRDDDLNVMERECVVNELAQMPGVVTAYLSRPYGSAPCGIRPQGYGYNNSDGGHIIVIFKGLASK